MGEEIQQDVSRRQDEVVAEVRQGVEASPTVLRVRPARPRAAHRCGRRAVELAGLTSEQPQRNT